MLFSRPSVPTALLFFLLSIVPVGCKKSAEGEASDSVSEDGGEKAEKADKADSKKSKKSKAKSKKRKASAKEEPSDLGEKGEASDLSAKSRLSDKEKKGKEKEGDEEEKVAKASARDAKAGKGAIDAEGKAAEAEGKDGSKNAAPATPGASPENPASAEVPNPIPTPPPSRIAVARLLTNTDLNGLLPMKGWASHGPVPGIAPSEFYNSILYRVPNTSAFAAIQVWDFEAPSMSLEKWNEIQATYPNPELYADGFLKDSLYSVRNQVKTFAFHEPKTAVVVAISCFSQACDDSALYQIAELVFNRLQTK